jgi:hypothetical protein
MVKACRSPKGREGWRRTWFFDHGESLPFPKGKGRLEKNVVLRPW